MAVLKEGDLSGLSAQPSMPVATEQDAPLSAWLGFLAMVMGMFMAVLDIQIVASSLEELQGGLSATPDEISWVQTSYLIAEIIAIPLAGFLTRLMSTRWLFIGSCAGFTAASLLCAFAWDLESMILFRALQGFLGGAMIPTVFAAPYLLFPRHQQEKSLIAIGLTATMAPTLGPVIGGWVTENMGWPSIFLLNLPPAALVIVAVARFVIVDEPDWSLIRRLDAPGLILLGASLAALQFALEEGPRWDWLESVPIRTALTVWVVASVLFAWRSLVARHPIVDLRAFADRNFATGCIASFIFGIGVYAPVYVLPLFLGQVRGYDPLQIGTVMIVLGAFQFLSAPLAANLSKVVDLRLMLALGLLLYGVGLLLNGFMTAEAGFAELFWPQAARGLALMLCFVPINTLALGTLPQERLANASGLYNLMRNLGGAVGIAAADTLIEARLFHHTAVLTQRLNLGRPELTSALSTLSERVGEAGALRLLGGEVIRQALVLTYNDLFLAMALVFFGALTLMPLIRRPTHRGVALSH